MVTFCQHRPNGHNPLAAMRFIRAFRKIRKVRQLHNREKSPNSVLKIVLSGGVKLFFVILEHSELKHLKVAPDTYQGRIYDKMTTFGKCIYALCAIAHTKMDFKPVHAFYILSTYNNLSKIIQDEK